MPGAGTHTTIIQHLATEATFKAALGDPTLNADWTSYHTDEALKSRYAVLGAMGPDIFYAMLDYGGDIQKFEDVLIKVAGTFQCVGEISAELNNYINGTLNEITLDAWNSIQDTFKFLVGILKDGILDLIIDKNNFWSLFLPLRQVDDYRQNWYWADFLHYSKTGCFTKKLLDNCQTYSADPRTASFLKAYSLGYLTHYVADTVGHAYVNRIVESPWRNCWQRHHLVENFIDAYVWDHWHDKAKEPMTVMPPSTEEPALDTIISQAAASDPSRQMGSGAPLHYSRLNDLCNVGSLGVDTTIDSAISSVCESIQKGLFDIGASSVPSLQAPDDPAFVTWANFVADAMWEVYPPTPNPPNGLQDHPTRLSRKVSGLLSTVLNPCPDPGGYPSADDVAGAYGAYRLVVSLATEDDVEKPEFPDIIGDISSIVTQLWNSIKNDLGSIPPPPSVPSSGGFSLSGLWDAIKSYANWLGQVAKAALEAVGAIIIADMQADKAVVKEEIKVALWALNSALYALYESVRMTLVMSAYSVPYTDELTGSSGPLDLQTLWKAPAVDRAPLFPVEPQVSQRDLQSNSAHPFSPYRPYFKPSTLTPVNIEMPATTPPAGILRWSTPDQMLETPLGKDVMLSASGPAPAATMPLLNPDGSTNANLETFDGNMRFFGGIFANCEAALNVAVPYVISGTAIPAGTLFPDYNMDADRGYAWPCWDVDYGYPNPASPFPWNGCDPYPSDTKTRVNLSSLQGGINWGVPSPPPATVLQPNLAPVDPFGNPRSGNAWVNARQLSTPGACDVANIQFPFILIDTSNFAALDPCSVTTNPASPGGLLPFDYQFAPSAFLANDPLDTITNPTTGVKESDGRLHDFLRGQARLLDPLKILSNAVTLSLGMGTSNGPSPLPVNGALVAAVAQLAVTGRASGSKFLANPPDDAALSANVKALNPGVNFNAASLSSTVHSVLDSAYLALWAIRGNTVASRNFRFSLGWVAVSGVDDTPHRPVNVPTAPYPQFDIEFNVPTPSGGSVSVTTRFMVASAKTFIGPNNSNQSSFTDPNVALLQAPAGPSFSSNPAPRTVPNDKPSIPPGNQIIMYVHGGGSRAEEAVGLANAIIAEGAAVGKSYTVISFDLPNSAFASTFEVTDVVGSYDPSKLQLVEFEQQFIMSFIDTLDTQLGNVKSSIVAVMGGSLGGNMSVLLSGRNDASHQYLNTIVSWSVTAMCPGAYLGIISNGWAGAYLGGLKAAATDSEPASDHKTESTYIQNMYFKPLIDHPPLPYTPPQPIMWYRAPDWQACKDSYTAQSRFDRYEIYSRMERHWISAIDLEQVYLSFQDDCRYRSIASSPSSRILLAAGDKDNFAPNAIFN
ncbi:MAG: zinc dependent phospholipase C family protein, partial [Thaumarchaeota archaeon]|nr:zinc dependent phospholipase C family protein [Nitrososphaerota archaeon]